MRKLRVVLTLLFLAACFVSCIPETENPLSDPAEAKLDKALLGEWTLEEKDASPTHLSITRHESTKGWIHAEMTEGEKDPLIVDGFTTRLGEATYLNIKNPEKKKQYMIVKYSVSKKAGLKIFLMKEKPVQAAIEGKKLAGRVKKGEGFVDEVIVTASSKELAAWVAANDKGETLFDPSDGAFTKTKSKKTKAKKTKTP